MPREKEPDKIAAMFTDIAERYDRANHLLSFNQDKDWRKSLVKMARPQSGEKLLDVATGTADIAIEFAQTNKQLTVTALDLSEGMLSIASEKLRRLNLEKQIDLVQGNALELPFSNDFFDLVTIGFGLRNLPDIDKGIAELSRVLKPQGRLLIMEFSIPQSRLWKQIYLFYLRYILPPYGGLLTGSRESYEYLHNSIHSFPSRETILRKLQAHRLERLELYELSGGLATIFLGFKQG